MQKNLAVYNDV